MADFSLYNEYGPITWYKRRPIYLTTFIAGGLLLGMVLTVLVMAAVGTPQFLAFLPEITWKHWQVWQIVTYPIVAFPSLWFAITLLFYYWVGVEVERYLGRPRYVRLLLLLVLAMPLINTVFWLAGAAGRPCMGVWDIVFGVFVACAVLYPNMDMFLGIPLKWMAIAGVSFYALSFLMVRDFLGLLGLFIYCLVPYGYVRILQTAAGDETPGPIARLLAKFKPKPKLRVVPKEKPPREEMHESIDPILDKISKSGLSSLSAKEKALLERMSDTLKKKE